MPQRCKILIDEQLSAALTRGQIIKCSGLQGLTPEKSVNAHPGPVKGDFPQGWSGDWGTGWIRKLTRGVTCLHTSASARGSIQ